MNYVGLAKEALLEHRKSAQPETSTPLTTNTTKPLEDVLKGLGIELWCDAQSERFWLVADEADAQRLGESRGSVYTASEVRMVIGISDPETVAEIHRWKRTFDGIIREVEGHLKETA